MKTPEFKISHATVDDHEEILRMVAAIWPEDEGVLQLARLELADSIAPRPFLDGRARWLVAKNSQKDLIGVACWSLSGLAQDMADFTWAAVLPDFRHQGIATLLLHARITEFKKWLNGKQGYIQVRTWPVPLYLNLGFQTGPITTSKGKNVMTLVIHAKHKET